MTRQFDLIAIGTGSAASAVASRCRSAGWTVAVVDSRPFGGTCALRGCDPKKVLVGAAQLIGWIRRMEGKGVRGKGTKIDWPMLMRFKRSFVGSVPKQREESFAKAGIATLHGRARFLDANTVRIGEEELAAKHVVIASGACPAKLNIPGENYLVTSDQFLELKRLPKRIVFVGGGYISFEFAHVAARAGAEVSVVHRKVRPLVGFDPDLVDRLVEATRAIGVDVELNTAVQGIEKASRGWIVHASKGNKKKSFPADLVVHGAGRVPEIEDLDLDKAGIEHTRKGVAVNEYLQSISNPTVYAAGDAAASGGLPLTPVASMEGRVVAANLLEGNHQKPDPTAVPTVVFTVPPLASVGLHEGDATVQGLKFKKNYADTSGWYDSRRVGLKSSGYKVLVEEQTQKILGAHLLGHYAEETINLFAMAIRFGIDAEELKKMRYSYPSSADNISYMV